MKTETPLKKWMRENRWTVKAVADSTGLGYYTVYAHVQGRSFPSEMAIAKYKAFGLPAEVIRDQISMLVDRA